MTTLTSCLCLAILTLAPQAGAESASEKTPPAAGAESGSATPATQTESSTTAPLVTDRPDATESAATVAPGLFQLETGYTFARAARTDAHSLGEVLLRVGVTDSLELRAGFNSYAWVEGPGVDTSGFTDTFVGLKWQIAPGGPAGSGRPAIAVLAGTSLPTGAAGLSDDDPQPEVLVAAGLDLNDRWSLGANLGWASRNDELAQQRFTELRSSLALGYGIDERWGAYFEYFGSYGLDDRPDENFLNGGLTYLIHHDLQLDGRVGYGLNGLDDDLFVGLGAAVRW